MTRNVILAGVGGQGLLALAAIIAEAARLIGLHLRQAEVHGMAQRGGVVQSHLRYADQPLHANLIRMGTANLLLALEPMEALRYVAYLAPDGAVVANTAPMAGIPDYPPLETILAELSALPQHRLVDAAALAREAGSPQAANMVLLGAGSAFLGLPEDALAASIRAQFETKGHAVVETNFAAFRLGVAAANGPT